MTSKKSNNSSLVVNLGLSAHEVMIYRLLLSYGSLSAKAIAEKINILPNAVYRLAKSLKSKKLVTISDNRPTIFRANSPTLALEAYTNSKIMELQNQKDEFINELAKIKQNSNQTQVNFITSRHAIFMASLESVKKAEDEILIISIGEQIPEEVMLNLKRAIDRGVTVNMIVHKYDSENKSLLESWKKMGWNIKHYSDWGFHLVIIDGKQSILSVNNPKNTNERVGIQFFSIGLSKAMQDYFYSVWKKAIDI
jgi:sugar-specific transcriptional regulator TrmB